MNRAGSARRSGGNGPNPDLDGVLNVCQFGGFNEIFEGNRRWIESRDPSFFAMHAESQAPRYLWIGCSDSRGDEGVSCAQRPSDMLRPQFQLRTSLASPLGRCSSTATSPTRSSSPIPACSPVMQCRRGVALRPWLMPCFVTVLEYAVCALKVPHIIGESSGPVYACASSDHNDRRQFAVTMAAEACRPLWRRQALTRRRTGCSSLTESHWQHDEGTLSNWLCNIRDVHRVHRKEIEAIGDDRGNGTWARWEQQAHRGIVQNCRCDAWSNSTSKSNASTCRPPVR